MTESVLVRPAVAGDLPRLTAIYNHYVTATPVTFDTEPFTAEQRREWFDRYSEAGRYRLLVAERGGEVAGYTSSSRYHQRAAYDTTVETTVLCAPEAVGAGIGRTLYGALFDALRGEDIRGVVALVTLPNRGSHDIHLHFGFREVGVLRDAGRKFGRFWDVGIYQMLLP